MVRKALGTIIGGVLALALIGFVPKGHAEERNQATKLTFNRPVRLPHNVVLPAGTYWFTVPDVIKGGSTVQVFNADRTNVLDAFETISTDRPANATVSQTIGDTQVMLGTIPNNHSPMLMGWIYPGQLQGREFLYSPQLENQLAETGNIKTVNVPNGGTVSVS